MEQETMVLTEQDIWAYWKTLFPEVHEEKKLEEMLSYEVSFKKEEVGAFYKKQNQEHIPQQIKREKNVTFIWEPYCHKIWNDNRLFKVFKYILSQEEETAKELLKYIEQTGCIAKQSVFLENIFKQLCERLFELSMRTLILEINVMRKTKKLKGATKEKRYNYYIDVLWQDEKYVEQFYKEYEHLYALQRNCVRDFLLYVKEVVMHTWEHRTEISNKLTKKKTEFQIKEIELGQGDTHKNGKTVSIIKLSNGERVVYKPRSLKMESGFAEFIKYMNQKMSISENSLYEIKHLNYEKYGFVEFITAEECKSREEIKNYYIRSGKLLAMLYALNAKDLHHENLIAHGENPVVIDLEALFHSDLEYVTKREDNPAYGVSTKRIDNSVYSIGLLPMPVTNPYSKNGESVEIGGLGGENEQISPFMVYMIKDKETDEIHLEKVHYSIKPENNVPKLNGKTEAATQYQKEIVQGFVEAYMCIMKNAKQIAENLSKWFLGAKCRIIYRATYLYTQLMFTSYHPDFMRKRAHRYVLFHRLAYSMKQEEKGLLKSEVRDLMRNDVPFFEVDIKNSVIRDSEGKELLFQFKESPLEASQCKIRNFNNKDLQEQLTIIQNAFGIKNLEEYQSLWLTGNSWSAEKVQEIDYLAEAEQIGEYLIENADKGVLGGKEDYCWVDFVPMGDNHINYQYNPLEADLYNGNSGIALFFLYLSKETGKQKYLSAAHASINSVICQMKEIKEDSSYLIGPFNGLSGYIYVLSKFYKVTKEKVYYYLVKDAVVLLDKIYQRDVNYDIISGSAGAIKVLLNIVDMFEEPDMKRLCKNVIIKLSKHIMEQSVELEDGSCVWTSVPSFGIYTGYAHGVCGIEEALASVYEKYPDEQIKEILKKSRIYVEKQFNEELGNWRTMKDMKEVSNAWCHGAPGILYSRVRLSEIFGMDEGYAKDIQYAIQSVLKQGLGNHICYCHGDIGNVELLQYAAEKIENQELSQLCELTYAKMAQSFHHYLTTNNVLPYGIMMGISGVGYSLLRRVSDDVPSVLRLN